MSPRGFLCLLTLACGFLSSCRHEDEVTTRFRNLPWKSGHIQRQGASDQDTFAEIKFTLENRDSVLEAETNFFSLFDPKKSSGLSVWGSATHGLGTFSMENYGNKLVCVEKTCSWNYKLVSFDQDGFLCQTQVQEREDGRPLPDYDYTFHGTWCQHQILWGGAWNLDVAIRLLKQKP